MADVLTPAQRSHCMSKVKGKNTLLEVNFRKLLWARGLRYRLGYKLPGKPDLVFVGPRVVVFVDGCFWHGCPIHGKNPATNSDFWKVKLTKNIIRDSKVNQELMKLGWEVVRFWEHAIKASPEQCVNELINIIQKRSKGDTSTRTKAP